MAADVAERRPRRSHVLAVLRTTARALASGPTSGWSGSTPLSTTHTSTSPRDPPKAHSRVTIARQAASASIGGGSPGGRLHAGTGRALTSQASATSRAAVADRAASSARVESSSSGRVARLTWTSWAAATLAASASVAAVQASARTDGAPSRAASAASAATSAADLRDRERDLGGPAQGPAERRVSLGRRGAARARGRRRDGRRRRARARDRRARRPGRRSPAPPPSRARRARRGGRGPTPSSSRARRQSRRPARPRPRRARRGACPSAGSRASSPVVAALTARGGGAGGRRRRGSARRLRREASPRGRRRRAHGTRSSRSIRSRIVSSSRRTAGSSFAASDPARGRCGQRTQQLGDPFLGRRHRLSHLSTGREWARVFFPLVSPARARPGAARGSGRSGSRSCPRAASSSAPIVR